MNEKNKPIFLQGYFKYDKNSKNFETNFKLDQKDTNHKNKNLKYSNGIFSFIFIVILIITVTLIMYYIGFDYFKFINKAKKQNLIKSNHLNNSLLSGSAIGFFCSLIWFIQRRLLGLKIKYSLRKFINYLNFKEKRKTKNLLNLNLAINNINSFEDYENYVKTKKDKTKIMFFVAILFNTFYFIICIILNLTVVF